MLRKNEAYKVAMLDLICQKLKITHKEIRERAEEICGYKIKQGDEKC